MTGSNIENVEATNNQIINDIQNLQTFEQEMFSDLEENPTLTQEEQQAIIQKINQVSSMRLNLYKTLNGVNGYFQNSLYNSQGTLEEQTTAINIIEQELNKAKQKLQILEEEKNNKIRLIEINTYYGEKYQEHTQLMQIIIYTLIPVIILAILYNKGFIPQTIYYILIVLIVAVGSYFMWGTLASIWNRDNMDYQEYVWPVYEDTKDKKSSTPSGDPWANGLVLNSTLSIGCVDQYCCAPGTTFDSTSNQCVTSTTPSSTTPSSTSTTTSSSTPAPAYSSNSILNASTNVENFLNYDSTNTNTNTNTSTFSLGGTESVINNTTLTEAFTKHSRIYKKPSATLYPTYTPKMSDSFIFK